MTSSAARRDADRETQAEARVSSFRPVALLAWIARFFLVRPAAGLYLLCRCAGFPRFSDLERHLPAAGRVLDVGCGYGLFAIACGARSPGRRVLGIDILEDRLVVGREVLRRSQGPPNVALLRADLADLPAGPFDAVMIAHVLLYRPLEEQRDVLARCRERLAAGGTLLLVETLRVPAWKARLSKIQETIVRSVRVRLPGARAWEAISPGTVSLWEPGELDDYLRSLGLTVTSVRLDRFSHLPHHLFIGVAGRAKPA